MAVADGGAKLGVWAVRGGGGVGEQRLEGVSSEGGRRWATVRRSDVRWEHATDHDLG
jgi:hypothetical protein